MAMTLHNGGLIHDENHIVHYKNGPSIAGKANAKNSQRKTERKPLGDVSNSRKPVLNQHPKWNNNTKNVTFIDEETGTGKMKNTLKGTRKVLSDISNSGKPNLQEVSKKKKNLKLSIVEEESIYEERFLHNHQECIKSRNCNMDKDHFLSIIGLDLPKELKMSTRKPDSPLKLKDMVEWTVFNQTPKKSYLFRSGRLSSPCYKSPRSPSVDTFSLWEDSDSINFTLIKTP